MPRSKPLILAGLAALLFAGSCQKRPSVDLAPCPDRPKSERMAVRTMADAGAPESSDVRVVPFGASYLGSSTLSLQEGDSPAEGWVLAHSAVVEYHQGVVRPVGESELRSLGRYVAEKPDVLEPLAFDPETPTRLFLVSLVDGMRRLGPVAFRLEVDPEAPFAAGAQGRVALAMLFDPRGEVVSFDVVQMLDGFESYASEGSGEFTTVSYDQFLADHLNPLSRSLALRSPRDQDTAVYAGVVLEIAQDGTLTILDSLLYEVETCSPSAFPEENP